MKMFRILAGTLASLALLAPTWADVRSIWPRQTLTRPTTHNFYWFGQDVAIDGGNIVVLAAYDGGQQALLYRRNTNGSWSYRRVLASVTGPFVRGSVVMKNGIAAVQFGDAISIFEYSGSDYVPGASAAPIRHPGGLAISGNSILIGGNDCDYDAVIYQKGANGNWGITGRLDDNQGECAPEGLLVELNYDLAMLHAPNSSKTTTWRRNGTALDWIPDGPANVPPDASVAQGPYALQKSTGVAPGNFVYRRTGNTWTHTGELVPVDFGNGSGSGFDVVYRDGVLLSTDQTIAVAQPYAYVETAPGQFEHVAILNTNNSTMKQDVSGKTVVTATYYSGSSYDVVVFDLPTELHAPAPIVNDFETRDVSGFTFASGQFALAAHGANDVLAQSSTSGVAVALVNGTDWTDYQRVEADLTPVASVAGSWVGLVARYVDANNYYYVARRSDNTYGIYRRLNGVDTLLKESSNTVPVPGRLALIVDGNNLSVKLNDSYDAFTTDTALRRGRAGLATFQTRAEFDDVQVAGADRMSLLEKDYSPYGNLFGRDFTEIGGNWHVPLDEQSNNAGLVQSDTSGDAVAYIGVPVENQEIQAQIRLDSFASSQQGAWFGLLARYVDARNHYYLTVRSTNQIQIRKIVNGVVTVLATANYTVPTDTQFHEYRLRVINDQLQAFADHTLVASAHDRDIPRGQYGVATYRAAATWETVWVSQP